MTTGWDFLYNKNEKSDVLSQKNAIHFIWSCYNLLLVRTKKKLEDVKVYFQAYQGKISWIINRSLPQIDFGPFRLHLKMTYHHVPMKAFVSV